MTHEIGIGVIGMGWVGNVHSRVYGQVADRFRDTGIRPRLVICADEVEARAREGQERFGFEQRTTDWKEVIENDSVQAISVASPNHLHLEVVRAAAAAGKDIFCEKPVGMGPLQTAEIEGIARRAKVISWVGYNYRWAPAGPVCPQAGSGGQAGRGDPLSRSFSGGLRQGPPWSALLAISEGMVGDRNPGRPHLPRCRHGPLHGWAGEAPDQHQPHLHHRTPPGPQGVRHPLFHGLGR